MGVLLLGISLHFQKGVNCRKISSPLVHTEEIRWILVIFDSCAQFKCQTRTSVLLVDRFMRFHNCCCYILFCSFRMNFAPCRPLCHFPLLLEDQPRSAYFGLLLTDICHFRRSLRRILWCNNAMASLGDAPVDVDLSKVSHSGGYEDLLDSKGQFHPPGRVDHRVLAIRLGFVNYWLPFSHLHEANLTNALWRDLVIWVLGEWSTRISDIFRSFQTKTFAQRNAN
jgi:hypothetical protein